MTTGTDFPITPEFLQDLRLEPLRETLSGSVRQASLVLFGVVVFVLLTACANVAHLLLSRVGERQEEMAIRSALGASRARLVRQLVTESMGLTLAAAAAGLVVAHWAARLAASVLPPAVATQATPCWTRRFWPLPPGWRSPPDSSSAFFRPGCCAGRSRNRFAPASTAGISG
jgi:ABC-type antimicrobial peptide transport system permease subunit